YFGPLMFMVTVALVYYMNFKYGASQSPELGDTVPREVRDRDYFYLWSFSAWSVSTALGLVFVSETIPAAIGSEKARVGNEPIYPYDSLRAPAIYRGKAWKKPSGPPLQLTMQQADAVPSVIELSSPQTFRKEGTDIIVNIQPRPFGDFAGLERADLFVLYMIR